MWLHLGVMLKSGVLIPESSSDQIDLCYLDTVFELYPSYHLGQVSTILDDYSRYIIAWKLCSTMKSRDVTNTLELALQAAQVGSVAVAVTEAQRVIVDAPAMALEYGQVIDHEDDFNGYRTLRISGVLGYAPTTARMIGHP